MTVSRVKQAAHQSRCTDNLRQLAAAVPLYAANNKGDLPYPQMEKGATSLDPSAVPLVDSDVIELNINKVFFVTPNAFINYKAPPF